MPVDSNTGRPSAQIASTRASVRTSPEAIFHAGTASLRSSSTASTENAELRK